MRRGLRNQVVYVIMAVFLLAIFIPNVKAQDIKPVITDALDRGDTTLAIELLNSEIEIDKAYHLNYYTLGMIYYNQMKYNKAAEQFKLALDKKSKHFESLYQLGLCQLALGELDKAEATMKDGIKKDKKDKHRFEDGYGLVLMQRKNYTEADKNFRQALVGQPDNPLYHIHLGDANFYQGVPALAIIEYEKALEVDTASTEVYYHWAEACLEMKDYTCAIEKLKVVLTKDSTHANAWMRAGGIYFKAGLSSRSRNDRNERFKEAIGSYKRYLELSKAEPDSSNVRVFYEMALSYSNLYGFEDAADYYKKVLSIPIEPRDIYFNYGKALWGIKLYDEAVDILLKHIDWVKQQGPDYKTGVSGEELYQLLGDCYFYRKPKDFANAIQYYKKSIEVNPDQKRLVQNIAIAYHSLKSYAQAIEYYNKRIELGIDSTSASILKNAGYCALNIANNGGVDEDEDIDIDMEEGIEPTTAVEQGTVDPNINYYEVAVGYMIQYMEYDPKDIKVASVVASTYLYQLADCANGVKYFENVLSIDPGNCEAKKSMGYAYFGGVCTKNYTKALGYLTDAYSCLTASGGACADVNLTLWIAQCYHLRAVEKSQAKQDSNSDFKNAFEWYGKVVKCEPNNAEAVKGQNDVRFEFAD